MQDRIILVRLAYSGLLGNNLMIKGNLEAKRAAEVAEGGQEEAKEGYDSGLSWYT